MVDRTDRRTRDIPKRICTHVHIKTALKWKLEDDDPRLPHIEKAGFGWVRQLTSFNCDQDLLRLFYSRFRPDTCTFSLGGKKYIISLEDVACLTGLSVDGQAIIWKENKDIYTLCENVLGRKLSPEGCDSSAIKFKWLRDRFEKLEDGATEDDVKFSAKAYILYLLGTFVLPNNSGSNVPGIYLTLLEDFEGIRRRSWGSSMLALLIENLKKDPSKSDVVNLGGNAALLQRTRRKLQLPTSSEENNSQDKATTDLSHVLELPLQEDTTGGHTPTPLKPPNQTDQENVTPEKADEPLPTDTKQAATVFPENVQIHLEGVTTEKVDELTTTQLAAIPSASDEALIDLNLDLDPDNRVSPTHSKGDTDIGLDTVGLNSPKSQETAEEPTPAIITFTPSQSTGIPEVQEQPQTAGPKPLDYEITSETPQASSSSVNRDGDQYPDSDLDQMISKVKTFSESYSKSMSEFSKSLTPLTSYHLSEETK